MVNTVIYYSRPWKRLFFAELVLLPSNPTLNPGRYTAENTELGLGGDDVVDDAAKQHG